MATTESAMPTACESMFNEEQAKAAFQTCDADADGLLNRAETRMALQNLGCADVSDEAYAVIDADADGMINYDEFEELILSTRC